MHRMDIRAGTTEPLWLQRSKLAVVLWLITLVVVCLILTRHWPLVNDGALQHYISFLTDTGLAPYRQIADMNLPGSLLIDWTVLHTLGGGPMAWRVFDALLLLVASAAMLTITRLSAHETHDAWFAGVLAAALFWLLHARDGMGQTGQRDMMEAMLLLVLLAAALLALRSGKLWPFAVLGFCAGTAAIIKPDSVLFSAIVFSIAILRSANRGRSFALIVAGSVVPPATAVAFLLHYHALQAFWLSLTEVTPFYASLGRQSVPELLRECLSPPMRAFLAVSLLLGILRRRHWTSAQALLPIGVAWGLASFFLQGKGYLYHRYPTLAFLLLWTALECAEALRTPGVLRLFAVTGLLYASLIVAPLSLLRASRATWNDTLLTALQTDLTRLGGRSLAGSVQCLDSISGCNTVLYRMQLPEETGVLSDFLLFGPEQQPAVRRARATFWSQLNGRPPRVIVVTGWLHPAGPDHFAKLALWPDFATFLATRYTLAEQRTFAPGQNGPLSYRLYTLR